MSDHWGSLALQRSNSGLIGLSSVTELPKLEELGEEGENAIDVAGLSTFSPFLTQNGGIVPTTSRLWTSLWPGRLVSPTVSHLSVVYPYSKPYSVVENDEGLPIAIPRVPQLCSVDPGFLSFPIGNSRKVAKILSQKDHFTVNYLDHELELADQERAMDEYWDCAIDDKTDARIIATNKLTIKRTPPPMSTPIVSQVVAAFHCVVHTRLVLGDHTLIVAQVTESWVKQDWKRPRPERNIQKMLGRRSSLMQ